MAPAASPYLRHRFPPEILTQCVLLYMRFPLSFRAVEGAMLLRGVQVSYETIRRWRRKFGQKKAPLAPKDGHPCCFHPSCGAARTRPLI